LVSIRDLKKLTVFNDSSWILTLYKANFENQLHLFYDLLTGQNMLVCTKQHK